MIYQIVKVKTDVHNNNNAVNLNEMTTTFQDWSLPFFQEELCPLSIISQDPNVSPFLIVVQNRATHNFDTNIFSVIHVSATIDTKKT